MVNTVEMPASMGASGRTYRDDDGEHGMDGGGHAQWLLPMLSDGVIVAGYAKAQADVAAASAASALNAPGTNATSTTSLTIGTGSKSLTIQTGKALVAGQTVVIASTAEPTSRMIGVVTAYDSGTGALQVSVQQAEGSGSASSWNVALNAQAATALTGSTSTSVSTTATLTTASTHVQNLTPTALGAAVILPAATTCVAGQTTFRLNNRSGIYSLAIRDGSGAMIGAIPPLSSVTVVCADISTTAGFWDVQGKLWGANIHAVANHEQAGAAFPVTAGSTVGVQLSSTLGVYFFMATAGLYAVAVDTSTTPATRGNPTLIHAGTIVAHWQAFAVSATGGVVVATASGQSPRATAFTVAGTTITVGSNTVVHGAQVAGTGLEGNVHTVQLSSSLYVCAFVNATTGVYVTAFSVAGTAVTMGANAAMGITGSGGFVYLAALSATSALMAYGDAGGTGGVRVVSVSGTTATVNGAASFGVTNAQNLMLLNTTGGIWVCLGSAGTGQIYAASYTVSGTTVTAVTGATALTTLAGSTFGNASSIGSNYFADVYSTGVVAVIAAPSSGAFTSFGWFNVNTGTGALTSGGHYPISYSVSGSGVWLDRWGSGSRKLGTGRYFLAGRTQRECGVIAFNGTAVSFEPNSKISLPEYNGGNSGGLSEPVGFVHAMAITTTGWLSADDEITVQDGRRRFDKQPAPHLWRPASGASGAPTFYPLAPVKIGTNFAVVLGVSHTQAANANQLTIAASIVEYANAA